MDFLEKTFKLYELLTKAAKDDTSEVASIAVCDGDSILMGKRRDNGRWTLPGGHLDKGEEKDEGAVRELFEEAGIKVGAKDLKYLGTEDVTTFTGKKKRIHAFKYMHDGERPTTKNDPDKEVEKWEWIDCKDGIPTHVAENTHTPVDKNCVFTFMKLKPAEKKEESSAKKAENTEFEIYKSNYGPKPMKLYDAKANTERKMGRTGTEAVGAGPNKEVKRIAPGGRDTSKNAAKRIAAEAKRKSKFNPVKIYSKEEIEKLKIPLEPKKKLAASELEKGSQGDWEKEGITLSYRPWKHYKNAPGALNWHYVEAHDKNKKRVGYVEFSEADGHAIPHGTYVEPEHRRKGLASAMYSHYQKMTGHRLTPDEQQSDEAKALWAQPNRPFGKSEDFFDQSPDWQRDYLQHQPQPEQPHEQKEDQSMYDIPSHVLSQLLLRGHFIRHPKRGIIKNRKHIDRGDGAPLMRSEQGDLELVHYSPMQGLREIDPNKMGTSGVRSGGQYKYGIPETKTSFHYIKGTEPEDIVTSGAKSKYKLSISPQHLYDLSQDPKGLVNQAVQENQGAWNTDMIFNKIKQNGYKGIWAPNADHPVIRGTVQLFHPHPVEHEEVK